MLNTLGFPVRAGTRSCPEPAGATAAVLTSTARPMAIQSKTLKNIIVAEVARIDVSRDIDIVNEDTGKANIVGRHKPHVACLIILAAKSAL